MPLVRQYSQVRKTNEKGSLVKFTPLRAIGLAVEEGHRYCKAHGLGRLSQAPGHWMVTREINKLLKTLYKLQEPHEETRTTISIKHLKLYNLEKHIKLYARLPSSGHRLLSTPSLCLEERCR